MEVCVSLMNCLHSSFHQDGWVCGGVEAPGGRGSSTPSWCRGR